MNKKISVGITAAIVIIAVTITFTATMIFSMKLYDQRVRSVQERATQFSKLYGLDAYVRDNFFYDLDENSVSNGVLNGFITGLNDEYSQYISAAGVATLNDREKGKGDSVGFTVSRDADGYMRVVNVLAESTAEANGLKAGDRITEVSGLDLLEVGFDTANAIFESAVVGQLIPIVVIRDDRTIDIVIECETLDLLTVHSAIINSEGIGTVGYIRISEFNDSTEDQFDVALDAIEVAAPFGFIIDLRDNANGISPDNMADILDRLVGEGTLLSATYGDGRTEIIITSDDTKTALPFALIVNEKTEYLAEVFAAVLKEKTNCIIVGKNTVGHGSMQALFRMTDGSGVLLTVARLNLPSGITITDVGVDPDYNIDSTAGYVLGLDAVNADSDAQFSRALTALITQVMVVDN